MCHLFFMHVACRIERSRGEIPERVRTARERNSWGSRIEGKWKRLQFSIIISHTISHGLSIIWTEKAQHHDSRRVLCKASWVEEEVWWWNPEWLLGLLITFALCLITAQPIRNPCFAVCFVIIIMNLFFKMGCSGSEELSFEYIPDKNLDISMSNACIPFTYGI